MPLLLKTASNRRPISAIHRLVTIAAARCCVYNPRVYIPIFTREGVAR